MLRRSVRFSWADPRILRTCGQSRRSGRFWSVTATGTLWMQARYVSYNPRTGRPEVRMNSNVEVRRQDRSDVNPKLDPTHNSNTENSRTIGFQGVIQ